LKTPEQGPHVLANRALEKQLVGDLDWTLALDVAIAAARAAGNILKDKLECAIVREKSTNDLVTDADIAAQIAVSQTVLHAFPTHGFLGEETIPDLPQGTPSSDWLWVVDPLDGTTNYAHGLRNFCVSIALMHQRQPKLGVVYDPMADEMFTAILGMGATLNGHPIRPSRCERLDRALIAASFPPKIHRNSPEVEQFLNVLSKCQSIRRLGSAALNLCFVACGRLDGYWGGKLNAWDIAAAALIATESGSRISRHDGTPFDPWQGQVLAASSEGLLGEIRECLLETLLPSGQFPA